MARIQAAEAERTRRRVLRYIAAHQDEHGWAPTVREIASAVGHASPSSIHQHLRVLHERGELVLGNGPRMIKLTGHIAVREPTTAIGHRVVGGDGRLQPGAR